MENTIIGDNMKRILFIILVIVFFCVLLNKEETNEEIRIRVIASSDNDIDQSIKSEVLKYLYLNYDLEFTSTSHCEEYIISNLNSITSNLNYNFDGLKITYDYHTFYNKAYNGIVEEVGTYKTLLIEIGDALGGNFWGILYTQSNVISTESIEYRSYIIELLKGERNVRNKEN